MKRVRYDSIDHYENPDGDRWSYNDQFRYGNDSKIPVYEEEVMYPELGNKRIVSKEYFTMLVLQGMSSLKYAYECVLEGCMLHISHSYWIKCAEPFYVVQEFAGNKLRELFEYSDNLLKG